MLFCSASCQIGNKFKYSLRISKCFEFPKIPTGAIVGIHINVIQLTYFTSLFKLKDFTRNHSKSVSNCMGDKYSQLCFCMPYASLNSGINDY